MTSSPLLQLDAISQRYARHSVVEQLSLSLQRGEIIAAGQLRLRQNHRAALHCRL